MAPLRSLCILALSALLVLTQGEQSSDKEEEKVLEYKKPYIADLAHFAEPFHSQEEFDENWVKSEAKKEGVEEAIARYNGEWSVKEPKENPLVGDKGLIFSSEAKHGAISSMLKSPFRFEDKPLIVQYEVKFQKKQECGGAYVKLLADSPSLDVKEFTDKTLYSIMFGPDKCGGDGKLHFIFQHENPITHKMEEKHAKKPSGDFNYIFDDGKTHLVTLVVKPDNSFEILVDKKVMNEGSLLKDMTPPVNPEKQIDDPEDKKPEDWDEREKIPDPDASKPADWDEDAPKTIADANAVKPDGWLDDEPELIADPAAVQPEDWDVEEDGEWEAPQINNPKCKAVGCGEWSAPMIKNPQYKGKWTSPLISNPKYKGVWKPRKIENPNFFEDNNPFAMKPIAAVGFELWSMQSDIHFDNIIIADDQSTVNQWTAQTWDIKNSQEVANEPSAVGGLWKSFTDATEEKPWLWAVAIGAILLPIILLYIFCFPGSKDDRVGQQKKTDEPVPDDPVEEEHVSDENTATKSDNEEVVDTGKDEKEEEEEKNVSEKEEAKSEDEAKSDVQETKEDLDEKVEESKTTEEVQQSSPSPRTRSKRKTRKD